MIDHDNKIVDFTKTVISYETRDMGEGITEEVKIIQEPWIDKVTLKACYDDEYTFIGFIGGVEVNTSVLDEDVPESIVPISEEETERPTWHDMPHHESKNNKQMLYICDAMPFNESWGGASNERFYAMVDIYGINQVEPKSDFFDMFLTEDIV